jgi:hypothetical protein
MVSVGELGAVGDCPVGVLGEGAPNPTEGHLRRLLLVCWFQGHLCRLLQSASLACAMVGVVWPMSLVLALQTAGVQCNIQSLVGRVKHQMTHSVVVE